MIAEHFFYTKQGNSKAKVIVFLHGFLEDHSIWKDLADSLSDDYCVIAIDLLGHGKTPTIAPVHTMERMAEEVYTILQKEAISSCTLVGHSMGGYVALAFAELFAEKVAGLILMNSTPLPDSEEKKANRDRVLKVIEKQKELFVRTAVTNLFSETNRLTMKVELEKLVAVGLATSNEGIVAASLGMKKRPDRTEVFEQLQAKKHIIMGKNDALIPYEAMIAIADRVGASYSLLSGGHLSYIENKQETLTTDTAIPFLYEYEKQHKERYVRIITDYGNIDIELFNETPYHRANFIFLTKQKYFDGTVFHRVVKNFVIQGGNSESWDISRRRAAIGAYLLPPDTKKGFKHHRGTVSMPSSDIDNPHQFASPYEFFIVVQKPGAYHLDGKYTAFGRVIAGMEVADKINQVETEGRDDWPKKDIKMKVIILNK